MSRPFRDRDSGQRATFAAKALLLASMGAIFFSTYGFANWLAGRHASVPSFSFAWEHAIPFWPWTIVPYWSIDLFYALSFFLWTWRTDLLDHVKRLLTVQIISVVCFIVWPLRFSFERSAADGAAGALFTLLAGFDKPFNQAPSLHIGLLVVLWAVYGLRVTGVWRWVLHIWFAAIGVSVLTTYQHHLIDVPTGAAVGCFALFLFPVRTRTASNRDPADAVTLVTARRIARLYAAGALLMVFVVWLVVPVSVLAGLLCGWLALALLGTACVYLQGDAAWFQKHESGSHAWAAHALFIPTMLGAFINSRAWTWREPVPTPVGHALLIGRTPTRREVRAANATGIVDLTAEMPRWARTDALVHYVCVPQLDLVPPTLVQLQRAVAAIERLHAEGRTVLVCCALGYSRSVLSVAAWLSMHLDIRDANVVLGRLREARPQAVVSAQSVALLQRFIDRRERLPITEESA